MPSAPYSTFSSITVRLADKRHGSPLAEITTNGDCSLGELRGLIRDCEDLRAYPHRMFSHWYVRVGTLAAEIPNANDDGDGSWLGDGSLLSEVGIADGSTVLLEVRGCEDARRYDGSGDANGSEELVGSDAAIDLAVIADRRSERRSHFTNNVLIRQLAERMELNQRSHTEALHAMAAGHNAAMEALAHRLAASEERHGEALREIAHLTRALGTLAQQQKIAIGALLSSSSSFDGGAVGPVAVSPSDPVMTVVTPCPKETFSIAYENSTAPLLQQWVEPKAADAPPDAPAVVKERVVSQPKTVAVITGNEEFFGLAASSRVYRPFVFPNAVMTKGTKCLVIYGVVNGSINIGIGPSTSVRHRDPRHSYFNSCGLGDYQFNQNGGTGWRGAKGSLAVYPRVELRNDSRRVAILFDLTGNGPSDFANEEGGACVRLAAAGLPPPMPAGQGYIQLFVSEKGSEEAGTSEWKLQRSTKDPNPLTNHYVPITDASLGYVLCGNLLGKGTLRMEAIYMNADIPSRFA